MIKEKNTYDELLYKSKPFNFSVPIYLETISTLLGLKVADSRKSSFLELGSSFGGNMLSQALFNPESKFIGVDLSEEQVKIGNEIIEYIGLDNIKLYAKNIMDIDEDFGKFDYITAHGVYSWVPDEVKDKILEILKNNLKENGVGYISYNVYPGWKKGSLLREMMLYANKYHNNLSLTESIERSKAIVNKIVEGISCLPSIKEERQKFIDFVENVLKKDNYYLAHEYLEIFNDPLYLHEFVDRVREKGLEYVSDINLNLSFITQHTSEFVEIVNNLSLGDRVIKEQCIDYILETNFRKSLICKGENSNRINSTESINSNIFDMMYYRINLSKIDFDQILDEEIKKYLEDNKNNIFKIEEFIEKYKNDDKKILDMYSLILNLMINDKVFYSLSKPEKIVFEENVTYIPEKFIKYTELCISEDNKYIEMGNYFNELIVNYFNLADLYIMQELAKPNTKENIIKNAQEKIEKSNLSITKNEDGEIKNISMSEYFDLAVDKISSMSFFIK